MMKNTKNIMDILKSKYPRLAEEKTLSPKEFAQSKADSFNQQEGDKNLLDGYTCEICKNKGFVSKVRERKDIRGNVVFEEYVMPCKCEKIRKSIMRMKRSGLENLFKKYTFNNYIANEQWQKNIKGQALRFAESPEALFFIGGQSGCVDADTEYFNGFEWKRIADYSDEQVLQYNPNSKKATLTIPSRYIVKQANVLYKIKNKTGSINQVLSADHDFAYLTSKGYMAKKPFAEVMKLHEKRVQGFYGRVETAFEYGGEGVELSESEIRLMCAVIADGHFKEKLKLCIVNLKKQRKIDRMRKLLKGVAHKEYQKSNGYIEFRFYAPRREKEFSPYWYNCNNEQLRIIAEEVMFWDGSIDEKGREHFFSTSKKSADFVQFAISATGSRSTIYEDLRKDKHSYKVTKIKNKSTVSMVSSGGANKVPITEYKPIDGKQYCFTVPTGYLVLRREGRIFVTGNCGKTHLCTAIARELLLQGKELRYILWRDESVKLKSAINDNEKYQAMIEELKRVDVLYIDDFLKVPIGHDESRPTSADLSLALEIINNRYNARLTTIISSEWNILEIIGFDEALGGRIYELTGDQNCQNVKKDKKRNYRIRNISEV